MVKSFGLTFESTGFPIPATGRYCLATLMSSDRTKQISLWMTIYIYIIRSYSVSLVFLIWYKRGRIWFPIISRIVEIACNKSTKHVFSLICTNTHIKTHIYRHNVLCLLSSSLYSHPYVRCVLRPSSGVSCRTHCNIPMVRIRETYIECS